MLVEEEGDGVWFGVHGMNCWRGGSEDWGWWNDGLESHLGLAYSRVTS